MFDHPTLRSIADSLPLGNSSSVPLLEPVSDIAYKQPLQTHTKSRDSLLEELTSITFEVLGTTVSADAPLMDSGLDSMSAMEL